MSRLTVTLLGLSLVVGACVPVRTTQLTPGIQPTQGVVQQPAATPTARTPAATLLAATSTAAVTSATSAIGEGACAPAVTLTAADGQITFQGTSFRLDPALATSVTAQQCAAVPFRVEDIPGTSHPAGVTFTLSTERKRVDFQPLIAVYAVEGDMQQYLYPLNSLPDLQNLLKLRTEPSPWFAAAPLHVRPQYLDFGSGAGVRGIVEYMQDIFFYTNNGLLYNFDGLTRDGRYYVNVRVPVAVPFLLDIENSDPAANTNPDAITVPDWPADYARRGQIIETYNQEALRGFDRASDADFTPDLAQLDALVHTLQIAAP
jgi:hypothetical protein